MTIAAPSSSRAGKPRPRVSRTGFWLRLFRISTHGIAVVAAAGLVLMAALTGAGWLLAVSRDAKAAAWSVALPATPSERLVSARSLFVEPAARSLVFQARAVLPQFDTPVLDPLGALAQVMPAELESSDDRIVTASLGGDIIPRRVAVEVFTRPPKLAEPAPSQPLPRPRPTLASLTPLDGITLAPNEENKTAIYDVTARVVYMPGGERLEAHSGLGPHMDDPNSRHIKNRGTTPPNTYVLTLRESLFHGVQAIRMTPLNEKAMFGRDGILAHSYMLGPSGQSNGCISFRDYPKFLNAYFRGEVKRIVVVSRLDRPPVVASRSRSRSAAVF